MSEANPDRESAPSDTLLGKHSKWDWFFAYGAALLVGCTVFALSIVLVSEILTPLGWPDLLKGFGQFFWFGIVLSGPFWLIGWPLAFGMRYAVGRFFSEGRLSFALTCILASQVIFGLFGINLPMLVFLPELDVYPIAVSQILAGAAGGWTWWGVENRLRRARAAKAAAKGISTADQNP